jgi:opacity protein-like surface antigen
MKKIIVLLAGLFLVLSHSAFAAAGDAGTWEITSDFGVNLELSFQAGAPVSFEIGKGANVGAQVGYGLGNGLQLVLFPQWFHEFAKGGAPSTDELSLRGGASYSFGGDFKNAFFLSGLAGIQLETFEEIVSSGSGPTITTTHSTVFSWEVNGGKRFALNDWVTYRPEVRYTWFGSRATTGSFGELVFVPIGFSFFF